MASECSLLYSPALLELLTPDVMARLVASGDEYQATLEYGSTSGVYARLGLLRFRASGVRLTSAASCDPEVVETHPVDTQLFVCLSAVRVR